jgi:thiosulfate/3-mercaptopyruvate sulfurtransferase
MVRTLRQVVASASRSLAMLGCCVLAAAAWSQDPTTVSPQALSKRLAGPNPPLVMDTRGRAAYLEGSVSGALDVGPDPAGFLPDSRGGEAVLVLEPGADPTPWSERLIGFGYRVQALETGMPGWRAAGLPVATPESSFVRPGSVPFVVPRGQCEMTAPAESFH